MFEAVAFEERHGKPRKRASWPAPKAALTYSGVPNARDRHRRHRSGQREMRDDEHLARGCEINDAVGHRYVELQRRVRIDDGVGVRTRAELFGRNAVREADELEVVGDLLAAAREYEGNLVAEHELRARDLEMTDVDGNVLRLGGPAEHVDHLEVLTQLDQIAEILERAGAPSAGRIHDVRRPRGRRECHALVR